MPTSIESFNSGPSVHPLYRLAKETPEQLDPCLRRAAFRMARRRFTRWLREVWLRAEALRVPHAPQRVA
jgi:hypothetical protein